MKIKISVINELINEHYLNELNNDDICISHIHQRALSFSPEMITFVFDIVKNVGYNALYDLIKFVLLKVINEVQIHTKNDTKITLIHNDDVYRFDFSFELNEEQKNKLIDAAIEHMFKDN